MIRFSASARRRLTTWPQNSTARGVAQRSLPNELQDHPGEQPQGHQTLIHPTLRIERGQLPELTGQKLG